ncbi:MAG: Two-component sensor histidine kinase [Myxococcaceae bacterium]|nr:Two-component sensor histidine kinase [Myxococcaceae bacterium]
MTAKHATSEPSLGAADTRVVAREQATEARTEPRPTSLKSPSPDEVLTEFLSLTRTVSLEMHDEEIVHAYVTSMLKLFPGRLFALRLFDAESGELSLVYATGRLRTDRRDIVFVTGRSLAEQGLTEPHPNSPVQVRDAYVPLFHESAAGFDVAIGHGRQLIGTLAVEYPPAYAMGEDDPPRIVPIALQMSASLRNARLLRESLYLRDYLTKLLEHANAPILVIGRKREIRVANRALLALIGFTHEELLGRDFTNMLDDEERSRLLPVFIAALRGNSATGVEVRIPSRRGAPVRLLMNTASILSPDGEVEGVIAIGRDLTEIRQLEQRIVHAEKLATVGQLAAGVVHELNNPLTSISVYSDYLLKQAEGEGSRPNDVHKLRRIHESADRILRFTRELLAYARPRAEEPRVLSVRELFERSLEYCDHLITERGVRVTLDLPKPVPQLLGVSAQLQQVLVNLITNACHAMPEGAGVLELSACETERGTVELRVTDNGSGISPDHAGRVFEPFFSTKGEGHGTGLGLSIVRNIIELHNGHVTLQSEIGHGTTFIITFPPRAVVRS